ncbi:hypothetical protein CEXT_260591 [Caerostris extrusa]|uniref:Uncharacterized protein n=1 Tax=Caerostris extrusa TaxID=172846 RepID=A0AAV4UFR1_CAEEX|nr:hypothetical protein CEXT_260591 [Caerostris extrusa]
MPFIRPNMKTRVNRCTRLIETIDSPDCSSCLDSRKNKIVVFELFIFIVFGENSRASSVMISLNDFPKEKIPLAGVFFFFFSFLCTGYLAFREKTCYPEVAGNESY